MGTVHIIGAGLAGLAAAVRLVSRGWLNGAPGRAVAVSESAPHAGGRCRTYYDPHLAREIDNGNHLMMQANPAALAYLETIGARDTLAGPPEPAFPFVDLETRQRWTVRPNLGRAPWWMFSSKRRAPGATAFDHLAGLSLMRARRDQTVADVLPAGGPLFRRLWEPLCEAVMNARPDEASAWLLGRVFAETFARGGRACKPYMARDGLGHSLVDPALAYLLNAGVPVAFKRRLKQVAHTADGVASLEFMQDTVAIGPDDSVILALPHVVAGAVLPTIRTPEGSRPIVNAHFRLPAPLPDALDRSVLGVVGAEAQWLFFRGDVVSVTVSAATALTEQDGESLAARLWGGASDAIGMVGGWTDGPPAFTEVKARIVKEKRATFLQTPDQVAARPSTRAAIANLYLAGDWTDTGLPATIEGAIRSGNAAADAIIDGA